MLLELLKSLLGKLKPKDILRALFDDYLDGQESDIGAFIRFAHELKPAKTDLDVGHYAVEAAIWCAQNGTPTKLKVKKALGL